jgi:hypothetical protein
MSVEMAEEQTIVFSRTPLARLISCTAVVASAALFFSYLAQGTDRISIVAVIALILLMIGTTLSALMQYGDHIYLGPDGLLYRNRFLPLLGRGGELIRWEEVVEVREIRHKILILLARDGRKLPVDAILGYPIARREILRRAPHAVISGTLRQEDRLET